MAAHTLAQHVRRFSSSVISRTSLVKPPIQVYGVEGRYATALYSAASKHNKLDQVERELAKVSDLIVDPKLSGIIVDPFVKRNIKKQMLRGALAEAKLLPITANFIDVLAENGRLTLFGKIFAAFAKMMSAHRGEVLCSVTTARPLDEAGLEDLKVALKGFLQKGETIKLETKSDPSILGGMIVSVGDGDKYVDMSTRTKIQKLTKLIRET